MRGTRKQESPILRIALLHALEASIAPIQAAFANTWPEADIFDVSDTALADHVARHGLDDEVRMRVRAMRDKALSEEASGLLFTGTAFGPILDEVEVGCPVPIERPNTGAFEQALTYGPRVGLLLTFPPSEAALVAEFEQTAAACGARLRLSVQIAVGALDALRAGDAGRHDAIIAEAAATLEAIDCVVLGQFSMARAVGAVKVWRTEPVLSTPRAAVCRLRRRLSAA